MIKRIMIALIAGLVFSLSTDALALTREVRPGNSCNPGEDICCNKTTGICFDDGSFACQFVTKDAVGKLSYQCKESIVGKVFGKIQAPDQLKGFLQKDPTGAGAISQFLSNLISLIYLFAGIILVFMLMWGAFDWITSEGEKEKLDSARKKIINALIGMVLLALVFAIIRVFGMFTGFRFFSDQNFRVVSRDPTTGAILKVKCLKSKYPNVEYTLTIPDPEEFCSKTP